MAWVIVAVALTGLILLASIPVRVKRSWRLEGIEDPNAVKAYDRLSRMPQFAAMRHIFTNELARYNPRGILADVGCGPGYLLMLLAKRFPDLNLIGVDISEEIISQARSNLGPFKNVEFKIASSRGLPFKDNSLDFLVSTLSLHHWSDPQGAFAEFRRVLKPGGEFLLFDMRRNAPLLAHFVVRFATAMVVPRAFRRMKEPLGSLLASYTPGEISTLLEGLRFDSTQIKPGFFWLFVWGKK